MISMTLSSKTKGKATIIEDNSFIFFECHYHAWSNNREGAIVLPGSVVTKMLRHGVL